MHAGLLAVVVLLVAASFGHRYRRTQLCAAAGCLGLLLVDMTMLGYMAATAPGSDWLVLLAATASATRMVFAVTAVPALLRA